MSRGSVGYAATKIERCLADWQEIGGGNDLAQRRRAPLERLRALGKRRGVFAETEIAKVADATERLRREIERW